jgi:hypothetical protein
VLRAAVSAFLDEQIAGRTNVLPALARATRRAASASREERTRRRRSPAPIRWIGRAHGADPSAAWIAVASSVPFGSAVCRMSCVSASRVPGRPSASILGVPRDRDLLTDPAARANRTVSATTHRRTCDRGTGCCMQPCIASPTRKGSRSVHRYTLCCASSRGLDSWTAPLRGDRSEPSCAEDVRRPPFRRRRGWSKREDEPAERRMAGGQAQTVPGRARSGPPGHQGSRTELRSA